MISEKELNSYRLTSMEEPTDEMLAQIMHEAAEIYTGILIEEVSIIIDKITQTDKIKRK